MSRLSPAVGFTAGPHAVTRMFEAALCEYTGSRYAVTTTSCTQAILMALAWFESQHSWHERQSSQATRKHSPRGIYDRHAVSVPRLTYVGVPAAVRNAGCEVRFRDEDWQGEYWLNPLPVIDSARRFTSGMHYPNTFRCVSFHWAKTLGLSQGGAILHDNPEADAWLRRARFDGRTEGADPKTDQVQYPSWHAYLSPEVAAHGLMKLSLLPKHNADLLRSDYPDLSQMEAFK